MHSVISPAILYWGSIVVFITTENEDGTPNIAPMSSTRFIGRRCMLGLGTTSKTVLNLQRTKQCVLNLASDSIGNDINALSHTTGIENVSPSQQDRGYIHIKDKFRHSSIPSDLVRPPCFKECPVQMEAELVGAYTMWIDVPTLSGTVLTNEIKILRVHVEGNLKLVGHENRVDADKWRPIIMSFQALYGLEEKAVVSKLATVVEEKYRPLTKVDDLEKDEH